MAEEKKWSDFNTLRYNIFDYLSKGEKTNLNDKEKEEVETAIKYVEKYSSEYNDYVNQVIDSMEPIDKIKFDIKNLQANQKAQFIASFFTGEILKENFNDKLKAAENIETDKVEQQPDKAETNVKNENVETVKAEQKPDKQTVKEENKTKSANKSLSLTRDRGDIRSFQTDEGFFTTQYVELKNSNLNNSTQNVTVARYTKDKEKKPLITIKKGDETVAVFYNVRGEGDHIFMDVLDPSLKNAFNESKVSSKEVHIDGLELSKKLDVRVKGLGKDIGVMFSAFGFQMQTPESNKVLKNDNVPYNVEISEEYLDKAVTSELEGKKENGCILGEDMTLNSSTMQSLLRASVFNTNMPEFAKNEKSFASDKVKVTSINYDTTINNQNVKRPIQFIEANDKISAYLSIVDGLTNKEKSGRFYEISKIRVTKDNRIFLKITDDSLDTIGGSTPHTRTIEIPHNNDNDLVNYINNILKNKNYENLIDKPKNESEIDTLSTNATLSNKEYGEIENKTGEKTQVFDSAGFINRNASENTFENLESAEEVKEVEHEQDVPSAPPAQDIDESNENSNDDNEPEYVSYNVAPDSIPPDDKTAEKPNDEQDPQNKTSEPANEPQQAQQTQEAQPAPQPEPQPTQEAQPTPQTPTPPTAPPAPENDEGPKKKSALDIPFIDGGKDDKGFDKDKSNELAAKLGIGMSAMAVVLFGFSVFMPFLAIIGIGFSVGSIVAFAKPWEFFSAGASSAVDRANAKLAKEKLKELKRERKAENALANEQKEQAERTVTKNKNQKQIDSLNEENVAIDARIAMLENQKRALQTQNAILLTHGQNEGEFKNFNIDDANMNEEEKEEFNALLASINVEEAQNEEDFKIPHGERAQIHKENLYETVKDLQKAQLDYNDAQNAYKEAETQLSNETQEVKKLRENQHVAIYLGFQAEKKKLEDKLATLSSEEDKKAVNQEIKTINDKINSLTVSDAPRKAVNEYLEQTDKLKTITENYETSKQKIEELKPQIDALTTKRDTQLAIVVNDSMVEAHKDDKEIMSDQKRIATVQINTQYINALDGEIAGLQRLKEQNEKLNSTISKKMEKEDFAKQVKKRDDEYSRRATSQQKLTESVDDYLTNISDVTKAEQEYVESQREEAKKSADLILQGYNLAAEKGLEGEELQKWLDDIDLNISNMKRTSPPEFSAGYDELRKQGEQKFGIAPERKNETGKNLNEDAVKA